MEDVIIWSENKVTRKYTVKLGYEGLKGMRKMIGNGGGR